MNDTPGFALPADAAAALPVTPGAPTGSNTEGTPALRRMLWRDHVRVGLGPSCLVFAGYRRGLRPRLSRSAVFGLEPAVGTRPWRAAVEAMPAALEEAGLRRPDVTVIVSNHFVRYALVPWSLALKSEAEWLALARHRMAEIHGPAVEDWVVRIAATGRQAPRLACAMDRELLEALEEKTDGRARLASVQPYVMAAFNRLRPAIADGSCWLAIEEPARLTVALIEKGMWQSIRSRRTDERSPSRLAEMLDREAALVALNAPCTRVLLWSHRACGEMRGAYDVSDLTPAAGTTETDRAFAILTAPRSSHSSRFGHNASRVHY